MAGIWRLKWTCNDIYVDSDDRVGFFSCWLDWINGVWRIEMRIATLIAISCTASFSRFNQSWLLESGILHPSFLSSPFLPLFLHFLQDVFKPVMTRTCSWQWRRRTQSPLRFNNIKMNQGWKGMKYVRDNQYLFTFNTLTTRKNTTYFHRELQDHEVYL